MKLAKAIKIAIECVEKEQRKGAPEANAYFIGRIKDGPYKKAADKYMMFGDAIKALETASQQMKMF